MVDRINLARIVSTHGVKGLLKIELYNYNVQNFLEYKDCLKIDDKRIILSKKFIKGNHLICQINMIEDKSDASLLLGREIWIYEDELKKINKKEIYHKDLIDCIVFDKFKNKLGKIKAIHNFGAGDILELDGNFKFMIRLEDVKDTNINIEEKKILLS